MKRKLVALVLLCLAIFSTCCSPHKPPPQVATSVPVKPSRRTFAITLHVDEAFTPPAREVIQQAADTWELATRGRVAITLVYDLDFDNLSGLLRHSVDHDNTLFAVLEDFELTKALDARFPTNTLVAATVHPEDGTTAVVLVVDRFESDRMLSIVTHEFGHVIGLPDLPKEGSVMSGVSSPEDAPIEALSPADVALCRAHRLCD